MNIEGALIQSQQYVKQLEKQLEQTKALYSALLFIDTLMDSSQMDILNFILDQAIKLSDSAIGYIYLYDESTETLTNYAWSKDVMPACNIQNPQITYELCKTGLWGDAIRDKKPTIVNDYQAENPRKKGLPEGHVPLKNHLNVPVLHNGQVVALIGVANKNSDYNEMDIHILQVLMQNAYAKLGFFDLEKKLRVSEAGFRATFEQAATGITRSDLRGNITVANDTFCQMLGYSHDEIVGKSIQELTFEPDWKANERLFNSLISGAVSDYKLEKRYIKKDGTLTWVLLTVSIMVDAEGGESSVIGIVHDINDKKKSEAELSAYQDRLESLVHERTASLEETYGALLQAKEKIESINQALVESNSDLQILYNMSQNIAVSLNLEDLLEYLQASIKAYLHADALSIHLYDEKSEQLIIKTQFGLSEELLHQVKVIPKGMGISGRAILAKSVVMTSIDDYPELTYKANLELLGFESLVSIPLMTSHQIHGTITLLFKHQVQFQNRWLHMYQAIGHQVAIAINNAKLYSAVQIELSEKTKLEEKQVEILKYLEMEKEFIALMMEISPVAIAVVDKTGAITYANKTSEVVLGIKPSETEKRQYNSPNWRTTTLEGQPFPDSDQPFVRVMTTGKPVYDIRQCVQHPDGSVVVLSINGTPHLNEVGDIEWIVFSMQDITKTIHSQNELQQSRDQLMAKNLEMESLIEKLEWSSITDPLTGLYNRRFMMQKLSEELERYKRYNHQFAIVMIDIDHFKKINDQYGHDCGDMVLKEVTGVIKQQLRTNDCLVRWGGEEFLLLLPETNLEGSALMAERIRQQVEKRYIPYEENRIHVTITLGITLYSTAMTIDKAINLADKALYDGKKAGRNRVVVGPSED